MVFKIDDLFPRFFAIAGGRGDDPRFNIDATHGVVAHVGDVKIARRIETKFMRQVERGEGGWTTVSTVSFLAGTSNRADCPIDGDATNAVPVVLAKPDCTVRSADHSIGIGDFRGDRGSAISAKPGNARSCEGGNRPIGSGHAWDDYRNKSDEEEEREHDNKLNG